MADEALNIYDEIEIEDMTFDPNIQIYTYPCPCGDRFEIAIDDLRDGEEIAVCPSCSLMIRVIFDAVCSLSFPLEKNQRYSCSDANVRPAGYTDRSS
jgi:diphthamide biosynthesis protein 3